VIARVSKLAYVNIRAFYDKLGEPVPDYIRPIQFKFRKRRVPHVRSGRMPKQQTTLTVKLKDLIE